MRRIAKALNRPASRWTAATVGALAVLAVTVNLLMVSCEGSSGRVRTPTHVRADAAPATHQSALPPGAPTYGGVEPIVRVRVLSGVESVALAAPDGLIFGTADPNPLISAVAKGEHEVNGGGNGSVGLHDGVWVLVKPPVGVPAADSQGAEQTLAKSAAGPLVVRPANESGGVGVNGAVFPGRLRLVARTDISPRAFDVVEFVGIEDYLPGVVAKEMPAGWPAEAYRVQAVCARTYALQERQRSIHATEKFDLESSEKDQAYAGGIAPQVVRDAVQSTRGQVILWNGALLRAYFSSTCGGRTAGAADTWPTGSGFEFNLAAPIQAHTREHACQASPLYRWTVERDRMELAKRIQAFGEKQGLPVKRLREIASIEAVGMNSVQRPDRFRVTEPAGPGVGVGGEVGTAYVLSGEELRVACNTDASGVASIDRKSRVNSSDFEARVDGAKVVFNGRGFGHGVGMCQFCTRAFAERGENWRAIVAKFYPGATITELY